MNEINSRNIRILNTSNLVPTVPYLLGCRMSFFFLNLAFKYESL